MGQKITYYRDGDGYLAQTCECPAKFKGVLFVGRGPDQGGDIDTVTERVFAANKLQKMELVAKEEVPDEWLFALGYEEPEPLFDEEGELLDVGGSQYLHRPIFVMDFYTHLGILIGLLAFIVVMVANS